MLDFINENTIKVYTRDFKRFAVEKGSSKVVCDERHLEDTIYALGADDEETQFGVNQMFIHQHNYAEWGVNGMFIFSKRMED